MLEPDDNEQHFRDMLYLSTKHYKQAGSPEKDLQDLDRLKKKFPEL